MHSDTPDPSNEKPRRRKVRKARALRTLRLMHRRFLLGLAYSSGSACVSLAMLWFQQRL